MYCTLYIGLQNRCNTKKEEKETVWPPNQHAESLQTFKKIHHKVVPVKGVIRTG